MGYNEQMQKCRQYIIEHINEQITALQLAELCGYSLYHFCRVFKAINGVCVGEYIRSLKLNYAAEDLLEGKSILSVALDCGYDTHAGFTKAFEKQFKITPSAYRKLKGAGIMNAVIKNENEFKVFGYIIDGDNSAEGGYWGKVDFSKFPKYPENCDDQGEVALWIHPEEVSGELKYFFGYKTSDKTPAEGFTELVIPAAKYAVFEIEKAQSAKELSEKVNAAWKKIFSEWFESAEYKYDESKFCFEFYRDDKTFIYVPVI